MTLFPSSAVYAVQDSADQLRIIFPQNWALALWWISFAVVGFVLGQWFAGAWSLRTRLIVPGICLLLAFALATSSETDVLSRTDGTLKMDTRVIFYHLRKTMPLKSIHSSVVDINWFGGRVLAYVMESGPAIDTNIGWLPRDGYYMAVQAINNFLAGRSIEDGAMTGAALPLSRMSAGK
jgi:hypothetical protein